jgi:2-polyprenyl-3-methyl-5-hydroxy-6-metoxy-1,4-benzoquinol methylase
MTQSEVRPVEVLSSEQAIQEEQYDFPYHYIPTLDHRGFAQVRFLPWGYEYLSYLSFVLDRVGELEWDALLDVGCGDGRFVHEAVRRFPGKRVVGVDYSARAIAQARAMTPRAEFHAGDVTDPSFLPERFQAATLVEVLEHIPPDAMHAFLRGVHARLAPGATLVVTVPSAVLELNPKHFQHFTAQSLARSLEPFFTVERVHHLNRASKVVRGIQRALTNRLFVVRARPVTSWFFRAYQRRWLRAGPEDGMRLCAVCRRAPGAGEPRP